MRLTFIGAAHPPGRPEDARRLDVEIRLGVMDFVFRRTIPGSIRVEGIPATLTGTARFSLSGRVFALTVDVAEEDGIRLALAVRTNPRRLATRSLNELTGELRGLSREGTPATVVLRADPFHGFLA
jgi:hypothetical protein